MFYDVVIQMTDAADTADVLAADVATSPSLATSRSDKRERKQTAQTLPPGITHNMMKKFVVYYREMVYLKNGKRIPREYFKVESHPKLARPWVTSKSTKVSLIDKLNDANEYVTKLSATAPATEPATAPATEPATAPATEPATAPATAPATELPKYTMLRIVRDTPTDTICSLVYDRKDTMNGFRWTCSHTFSSRTTTAVALHHLRDKLREKYGVDLLGMTHE
jgi:hypothetical protein